MATKALVLAAGFGTRMKPLTDVVPKPLLPFLGVPLIEYCIKQIRDSGITEIAVNAHHLPHVLENHLNSNHDDIFISIEPEILGTGGSIFPLRSWIGSDDLLIYNSDIICDVDLRELLDFHNSSSFVASMVMLQSPATGKTPVATRNGEMIGFGHIPNGSKEQTFTGIHLISNQMVQESPQGFHSIIDTYKKHLSIGQKVGAFSHNGDWLDLGTPEDFWKAHIEGVQDSQESYKFSTDGCFKRAIGKSSVVSTDAIVEGHVLCFGNTIIKPGAKVENSIIIDSTIQPGQVVSNQIVYKQIHIDHSRAD